MDLLYIRANGFPQHDGQWAYTTLHMVNDAVVAVESKCPLQPSRISPGYMVTCECETFVGMAYRMSPNGQLECCMTWGGHPWKSMTSPHDQELLTRIKDPRHQVLWELWRP